MKINSVRLGFANNSSSSHSILLGSPRKEKGLVRGNSYGWELFHLRKNSQKRHYFAAQLFNALPHDINDSFKVSIVHDLTGVNLTDSGIPDIDHQSCWDLPKSYEGKVLDEEFINDFLSFIDREDISIRGGNDNTPSPDFKEKKKIEIPSDNRDEFSNLVCRKNGDYFTLFSRDTGAKIRLTFNLDENGNPKNEFIQSTAPELVDICLTHFCDYGCKFCYMGSTANGKHADHSYLKNLIYTLSHYKVFEVAFGGGQPTKHPNFGSILSYCRTYNIVPNFTTFNMDWVDEKSIANHVAKYAGSFAVSSIDDISISKLRQWNRDSYDYNYDSRYHGGGRRPKGSVHIPLGCYPSEDIINFLKGVYSYNESNRESYKTEFDIMFLGFKSTGRGKVFPSFDSKPVVEFLKEKNKTDGYIRFGADTLFVKQFKNELEEMGVSESMIVGSEGKFSCYIDAVSQKIAPCSYAGKKQPFNKTVWDHKDGKFPYFPFSNIESEENES